MDRPVDDRERAALLADLFGQQLPTGAGERLLRTSDVAMLFQVSERTVSEWARRGRVPSVRTPGGHRRYPADQIRRLFVDGRHGTVDTPAS
jgi:excisionase family DNA binding protein